MEKETKRSMYMIAVFLWIMVFIVFMVIILIPKNVDTEKKQINNIDENTALVICQTYYEQVYEKGTGLKAKINAFYDYKIYDNGDTWKLQIWGECQNVFSAWMQIPATCVVNKKSVEKEIFDYANIVDFKFNER